jgi:hypothetical protein
VLDRAPVPEAVGVMLRHRMSFVNRHGVQRELTSINAI